MTIEQTALKMIDECVEHEQAARRVKSDAAADDLRRVLRAHARARGLRVRTARMDDTVVIVRTDAAIWHDDAATMRRKLTPPPS